MRSDAITEERLKEILNETVEDVMRKYNLITEMTIPLKTYKETVEALRFQLVENWCLCKWCQLFSPEDNNFSHWMRELRTCISNLKFVTIKNNVDKRKHLSKLLISDYDYNDPNMIDNILISKFNRDNITDKSQRFKAAAEFADNIEELIEVIAAPNYNIDEYIYNTFKFY